MMKELEKRLQYTYKNIEYLRTALTHSSYANEARGGKKSNERLEFLGDAVLSIVVSDYLFLHCPHLPEGDLTKLRASLVCEKTLCRFSRSLGVGDFLRLSRGEQNSGGKDRPSILADAFEAIIASIYLDGGLEEARKFILRFVLPEIENPKPKAFKVTRLHCRKSSSRIRKRRWNMCSLGRAVRIMTSILWWKSILTAMLLEKAADAVKKRRNSRRPGKPWS